MSRTLVNVWDAIELIRSLREKQMTNTTCLYVTNYLLLDVLAYIIKKAIRQRSISWLWLIKLNYVRWPLTCQNEPRSRRLRKLPRRRGSSLQKPACEAMFSGKPRETCAQASGWTGKSSVQVKETWLKIELPFSSRLRSAHSEANQYETSKSWPGKVSPAYSFHTAARSTIMLEVFFNMGDSHNGCESIWRSLLNSQANQVKFTIRSQSQGWKM